MVGSGDRRALGRAIRRLRKERKWSQGELGARVGSDNVTVSRHERGVMGISMVRLREYAEAFGVSAADLLAIASRAMHTFREEATFAYGDPPAHQVRIPKRLPPRVYERVHGYIGQLEDAGVSEELVEEVVRLLTQGGYNKLNARDARERTEDDVLSDMDAAWDFVCRVLDRQGVKIGNG